MSSIEDRLGEVESGPSDDCEDSDMSAGVMPAAEAACDSNDWNKQRSCQLFIIQVRRKDVKLIFF